MLRFSVLLLSAVICALISSASEAELIVTVKDAVVAPGGTAFVDVLIESDASDPLQFFGFDFNITTGGATRLEFVDPQPDPQLTDPNYVFFGDSFDQINSFPVGRVIPILVLDTFIGGDFTDSFADVRVIGSLLLARLEVTAATDLAPGLGDTFTVTLDDTSSNTFFFDSFFTSIDIDIVNSDLTGTVTVANVVPEPSSLLALAGLSTMGLVYVGLRRRKCRPSRLLASALRAAPKMVRPT